MGGNRYNTEGSYRKRKQTWWCEIREDKGRQGWQKRAEGECLTTFLKVPKLGNKYDRKGPDYN